MHPNWVLNFRNRDLLLEFHTGKFENVSLYKTKDLHLVKYEATSAVSCFLAHEKKENHLTLVLFWSVDLRPGFHKYILTNSFGNVIRKPA